MMPRALIHTALLMAMIAAVGIVAVARAPSRVANSGRLTVGNDATTLPLDLAVGKSVVYDFSRAVKDVLIADPKIANVAMRS